MSGENRPMEIARELVALEESTCVEGVEDRIKDLVEELLDLVGDDDAKQLVECARKE